MFPNIYLEIHHLANVDVLIQIVSKLLKKITFANLYKTYNDVIIIPIFNFHFEWKKLVKTKEYYKN